MNAPNQPTVRSRSLAIALAVAVASGFGAGYSPIASGTVGTLWGVVMVWWMHGHLSWPWQIPLYLALSFLAVPFCHVAEQRFGVKDDQRIVADEFLTFPLCMIGLPLQWETVLLAFITHRLFDILKPPPARTLQRLPGGWGIVVDDAIASVYALCANHLIWALLKLL